MGSSKISLQEPLPVRDAGVSGRTVEVSETINIAATGYIKDAADVIAVVDLAHDKIRTLGGAKVGSYWGEVENRVLKPVLASSLVKTDTAAAVAVSYEGGDLEELFESVTLGRFILKTTDSQGNVLYGWIGGVAAAGDVYTFSIYNSKALATQSWFQGGATAFQATGEVMVEVYQYSTSLSFGSSGAFLEEVGFTGDPDSEGILELTAGQYVVDYENGIVYVKKANDDNTAVATYKIKSASMGSYDSSGALSVTEANRAGHEDNVNNVSASSEKPNTSAVYSWDHYQGQALDSGEVIKAVPGKLKSVTVLIDTAAASDEYFLHILDATAIPIDGPVTLKAKPKSVNHTAGVQSEIKIEFANPGIVCSDGIVAYLSTSQIVKAITGNVGIFSAEFK